MFRKDNVQLGLLLGFVGPLLGLIIFKLFKFSVFTFKEVFQFMLYEPGFRTLSVALSLSLLVNAVLFTIFVNNRKDLTAKGIFIITVLYALVILIIKYTL